MKRILQTLVLVVCVLGLSCLLAPSALAFDRNNMFVSDFMPLPYADNYIVVDTGGTNGILLISLTGSYDALSTAGSTDISYHVNRSIGIYRSSAGSVGYLTVRKFDENTLTWGGNLNLINMRPESISQLTSNGTILFAKNARTFYPWDYISGNNIPLVRVDFSETVTEVTNETIAEAVINELGSFFPYYAWEGGLTGGSIYLARDLAIGLYEGNLYSFNGTNVLKLNYTVTQTANGYTIGFTSDWLRPKFTVTVSTGSLYTNASTMAVNGAIPDGRIKPWMEYEDAFSSYISSGQTTSLQDVLFAIERLSDRLHEHIHDSTEEIVAAINQQTLELVEQFVKQQQAEEKRISDIEDERDQLVGADIIEKTKEAISTAQDAVKAEVDPGAMQLYTMMDPIMNPFVQILTFGLAMAVVILLIKKGMS